MTVPPPSTAGSHITPSAAFVYGAPQVQPFGPTMISNGLSSAQNLYGSYVPSSGIQVQPSAAQIALGTPPICTPPNIMGPMTVPPNAFPVTSIGVQPSGIQNSLLPHQGSMLAQYHSPPTHQIQSSPIGGSGLKRKLPIPPSPENSP